MFNIFFIKNPCIIFEFLRLYKAIQSHHRENKFQLFIFSLHKSWKFSTLTMSCLNTRTASGMSDISVHANALTDTLFIASWLTIRIGIRTRRYALPDGVAFGIVLIRRAVFYTKKMFTVSRKHKKIGEKIKFTGRHETNSHHGK